MSSNIRTGFVTGSGALLDSATSVTIANTRIKGIYYTGVGSFVITGTQTDSYGNITGSNIKFVGTTASDANDIMLPDFGIRTVGPVKVSAPTSTATVTVFYG